MITALLLGLALGTDPFSLEWTAPEECPSSETVTGRIAAAIGDVEGPPLRARVEITALGDQTFSLSLTLGRDGEPQGARTLEGPTCAAVTDAAVLIVAIAIDPNAAASLTPDPEPEDPRPEPEPEPEPRPQPEPRPEPEPEPRPQPEPEPRPQPSSQPEPAPQPQPDAPPRVSVDLAVSPGLGFGTLPALGGAFSLHTALHGRLWRAELGATYETPRETSAPSRADVRGSFQLWSIELRGCPVLGRSDVTVPLCVGARAGLMHGAGRGVEVETSAASPWIAVSMAPTLLWRPPTVAQQRLLLGLRGEASISLTRPGFATTAGTSSTEVFEAGLVGGQVSLLVGVRLRGRTRSN